jgi:pimeloyl-ACP methyl ester carboxylesterase
VYSARGYPPSDAPDDPARYSQDRARDDIRAILDGLAIDRAHIVGLSMGGFATLHFGLRYPERALSLVVAGCGYGADPTRRDQFQQEADAAAERFATTPPAESAQGYALGPTRVQFQNKDPRGWEEFRRMLAEHSPKGSALTLRGVQKLRPSLYDLVDQMQRMTPPTLIIAGDEDDPCLEASLMMKRTIPTAGLAVLPRTGHTINLEEPAAFNTLVAEFLHQVEVGRWTPRDPRSRSGRIL